MRLGLMVCVGEGAQGGTMCHYNPLKIFIARIAMSLPPQWAPKHQTNTNGFFLNKPKTFWRKMAKGVVLKPINTRQKAWSLKNESVSKKVKNIHQPTAN